jgi:hypothetical protein
MNELIERLATESGLVWTSGGMQLIGDGSGRYGGSDELAKFAALVAEECAKECDALAEKSGTNRLQQLALDLASDAIRGKFHRPNA